MNFLHAELVRLRSGSNSKARRGRFSSNWSAPATALALTLSLKPIQDVNFSGPLLGLEVSF